MKFFHLLRVEGQKVEAACSSKIRLKVHLGVRLAPDPVVSPVLCDEHVPAWRWRRPLIVTHLTSELELENFCRAILSYSWLSLHKQTRHADFGLPAPLAEGLWMLVVRGGIAHACAWTVEHCRSESHVRFKMDRSATWDHNLARVTIQYPIFNHLT